MKKTHLWKPGNMLLLAGILLIAMNLRPALASVGPLVSDIQASTGLSNGLLGLLTTLPLIAFGIISTLTPLVTRRLGMGWTLFLAMALLTLGIVIRSFGPIFTLYFGTLLIGVAISFGNVMLPSLTKRNFSENSGLITSLYSSVMAIGAALAAGLSVPLAQQHNLGWQGSLAVWAVCAFLAVLLWLPQVTRLKRTPPSNNRPTGPKTLLRSKLAWQVALFMGLQSLTFYVILAWLPSIIQDRGHGANYAGWMLSLSQATGILGSLLIPVLAGRRRDQRSIVLLLAGIEVIGLVGLIVPSLGLVWLWVSLIGFVLGGTFGLSLLFLVLRSRDSDEATSLSGMAQSIGYIIAATGPSLFGAIIDIIGSWTPALAVLFVIAALKFFMGMGAAKPGKV
ncbi:MULTISPECIES: CynX/NimT family MFS transporter [unclassified Allomuricauda]|uniref:CynX/NimT family MFS transporter n=1 Tax=Flavobacteriaceae TaxID=49546 RepID=UPI00273E3281|nr:MULTISPECIES: MFS transporter [unclassified Allomuricauda]